MRADQKSGQGLGRDPGAGDSDCHAAPARASHCDRIVLDRHLRHARSGEFRADDPRLPLAPGFRDAMACFVPSLLRLRQLESALVRSPCRCRAGATAPAIAGGGALHGDRRRRPHVPSFRIRVHQRPRVGGGSVDGQPSHTAPCSARYRLDASVFPRVGAPSDIAARGDSRRSGSSRRNLRIMAIRACSILRALRCVASIPRTLRALMRSQTGKLNAFVALLSGISTVKIDRLVGKAYLAVTRSYRVGMAGAHAESEGTSCRSPARLNVSASSRRAYPRACDIRELATCLQNVAMRYWRSWAARFDSTAGG